MKIGDRVTIPRESEWSQLWVGTVESEGSCGWAYGNSKDTEVGFWIHWDFDERYPYRHTYGWVPKNVSERVIQVIFSHGDE